MEQKEKYFENVILNRAAKNDPKISAVLAGLSCKSKPMYQD
jgi:hypothetical protein